MEKAMLVAVLSTAFMLSSCGGQLAGACYQAMEYRREAQKAQGTRKAALLGKADAAQRECDKQAEIIHESQRESIRRRGQ